MLVALLHRQRTGEGQFIDLSQVQCMLPFTAAWAIEQSANGRVTPRAGNRHPLFVPHGVFPCVGTDKWVLITVTDDEMWASLARVIGLHDPALATSAARRAAEDRIDAAIADWTRQRSPDEAMDTLQKAGVAAGAVRHPGELLSDSHLKARAFWQWLDRAHVGRHPQPSPPYREEDAPLPLRAAAATLGQHNEEILGGLLGRSAAELARLERDHVIGSEALPPAQRKARAMTG
jgi:crotonobetainyl-CoA:carnitine CoA-transferase CaiB-like acyl-CoA transferase